MSSPEEFHDTSEHTPLLPRHCTTTGAKTSESARGRSFLPSLLPWYKTPAGEDDSKDDKGGNGSQFSHRPPPPSGGHDTRKDSTGLSPSATSDNPVETAPGPDLSNATSSSALNDGIITAPWGDPAGLDRRKDNDENVVLFREAIGISAHSPSPASPTTTPPAVQDPESGVVCDDVPHRKATGIYRRILAEKEAKSWQACVLNSLVNACHIAQILVGAVLTTLGPSAQDHTVAITALGATNTVLAGVFALLKGQGLPDRLRRDATAFRRVQDWIDETDALLVAGVVGRDRHEVGMLVETAFQKYNAVVARSEEMRPPEDTNSRGMPPLPPHGQELLAVGSGGVGGDGDADEGAPTAGRRESQAGADGDENKNQANAKIITKVTSVQVE